MTMISPLLNDNDFSPFAAYRLPYISEGKYFYVSLKHKNYFALFSSNFPICFEER